MRIREVSIIIVLFICLPQYYSGQQELKKTALEKYEKHFGFFKAGVISGNSFQFGYSRKFFKATYVSVYAESISYSNFGTTIWTFDGIDSPTDVIVSDPEKRSYIGLKIGRRMILSKTGKSSFHLSGGWAYVRDHLTQFDKAVYANLGLSSSEINKDRNNVAFVFTSEFQKWCTDNFGMTLGFSGALFDNNKGDFLLNIGVTFALPKKD